MNVKQTPSTKFYRNVVKRNLNERFIEAVFTRNLKEVRRCLMKNIDPNVFGECRAAALHIVAETGDVVLGARLLGHYKIDINIKNPIGYTPLMLACIFNKIRFADLLLSKGADPNVCDRFNISPLEMTVRCSSWKLMSKLVQYNANINWRDCFDNTALSVCLVDRVNLQMAQFLVDHGANLVNDRSQFKMHIFLECILKCSCSLDIACVKFCLRNGVDVNIRDYRTGKNCLHIVALTGYVQLAEFLLKAGAKLNIKDLSNRTPIMIAYDNGNKGVYNLFSQHSLGEHGMFLLTMNKSLTLDVHYVESVEK